MSNSILPFQLMKDSMSSCILLTPLTTVITLIRNSLHRNFHAILTSVGKRKLERYTRKVKVLSLPETIKEKSTVRAKALRRELIVGERAFARNVDFFFIVSGSERTFTFRVSLKYTTYIGNVSSRKIYSFSHKYVPQVASHSNFVNAMLLKSTVSILPKLAMLLPSLTHEPLYTFGDYQVFHRKL